MFAAQDAVGADDLVRATGVVEPDQMIAVAVEAVETVAVADAVEANVVESGAEPTDIA